MRDPIWAILRAQGRHMGWLAEQLGYSHGFVRLVACGKRPPTAEFQRRCAHALSIPASILFVPRGPAGAENKRGNEVLHV